MATLEIEGRTVAVDDSFKSMSPEQQAATVEEIAQSMDIQAQPGGVTEFLGQAARSIGGAADFLTLGARNDIRSLRGKDPIGYGEEGTAVDALTDLRIASPQQPQNITGRAGAAAGDAITAFAPVLKSLQAARGLGGTAGAIADDAVKALSTRLGLGTEVTAGALSGGAQATVEQSGGGETAQSLAGLVAPLSVPAAGGALRSTAKAADTITDVLPGVAFAKKAAKGAVRAVLPMTDTGARQVARTRMQDLAGGTERADRIGQRINPADEFGRTGAEQTGDPNLMGLQNAARSEDPNVNERLLEQAQESRDSIVQAVREMGGDVSDARSFFRQRLRGFKEALSTRVDRVIAEADTQIQRTEPRNSAATNSINAVDRLKAQLDSALMEEAQLWGAVPTDAQVGTQKAREAARRLIESTPRAQQDDIPRVVSQLLGDEGGFSEHETVAELHGLYSELRRVARSAMAGSDQNKNQARIANTVAEAILEDLGTLDPNSSVGQAVAEARAFSRAIHETFDRGAVGRILKRTLDGAEAIAPETALDKTVGRSGTQALADDLSLRNAATGTGDDIADYLRERFSAAVSNASGEFTSKSARTWLRNNRDLLARHPGLAQELRGALKSRHSAQVYSIRAAERVKLADQGGLARFNHGQPEKAVSAILGADSPIRTAQSIAATARKDPTGKALAGVKGAFADYLTKDPQKLPALMSDAKMRGALSQVFTKPEMNRLHQIGRAMDSMNAKASDVGDVANEPANKLVEMVVRIAAAQRGGAIGERSAGGSLQTAQIFSERARTLLRNLTNDKARQMLTDAVEDPKLMRALLTEANTPSFKPEVRSRLAPYLAGAISAHEEPGDGN